MKQKKERSWGTVFFTIIIFLPLGLYFLYKKISTEELLNKSKILKTLGWIWILLWTINLINSIQEKPPSFRNTMITYIIIISIGGLMIYRGKKAKGLYDRKIKYITILMKNHQTHIEYIANDMNLDAKKVIKDLKKLINEERDFRYMQIDVERQEVILPIQNINMKYMGKMYMPSTQPIQQKSVACKNCAANNTVTVGKVSECEFCGSPLQY